MVCRFNIIIIIVSSDLVFEALRNQIGDKITEGRFIVFNMILLQLVVQ